jgi:hypothetical protein
MSGALEKIEGVASMGRSPSISQCWLEIVFFVQVPQTRGIPASCIIEVLAVFARRDEGEGGDWGCRAPSPLLLQDGGHEMVGEGAAKEP